MKKRRIDEKDVTVFRVRGVHDGGGKLLYLIDMGDGTFAEKSVWWNSPEIADEVYDFQSDEYVRWAKDDALRRLSPVGEFTPDALQPDPTPEIRLNDPDQTQASKDIEAVIARRQAV